MQLDSSRLSYDEARMSGRHPDMIVPEAGCEGYPTDSS